jgi:hypothetical protein
LSLGAASGAYSINSKDNALEIKDDQEDGKFNLNENLLTVGSGSQSK